MYRVDRYGIDPDVPTDASIDELMDYCESHIRYINARDGTYLVKNPRKPPRLQGPALSIPIPEQVYFALAAVFGTGSSLRFEGESATPKSRLVGGLKRYIRRPYPRLHLNACGDFTLLARERWFELRGYPELQMYSFHIDSMLCCMAYEAGLREVVLKDPMRIYHIDHAPGIASERRLKEIMNASEVPMLLWPQVRAWVKRVHNKEIPIVNNDEKWGLATEVLIERALHGREQ